MTSPLVPLDTAVERITDALADQTHFVVVIGPDDLALIAAAVQPIPGWIAYADNGQGEVLRTNLSAVLQIAAQVCPTAAVVLVPKTVPARTLSDAIGHDIPADGSKDILVISTNPDLYPIPMLFWLALNEVDPAAAAALKETCIQ